jgi:hypothetical protein
MANRLLDRQVSLLDYLTSSSAIFGGKDDTCRDPALQGIDRGLLRLEARFSHEKRMEKIVAVFPKTFKILGRGKSSIVRAFVQTCPPVDIGRLANAGQFHDFLLARWRRSPPKPAYLRDVAACELACAKVRAGVEAEGEGKGKGKGKGKGNKFSRRRGIRRHPDVVLLRCAYDVRLIFEAGSVEAVPAERDTPIGVTRPREAGDPQIFELLPVVFDLLTALNDWTDPATLGTTADLDELINDLAQHGLLQVRR